MSIANETPEHRAARIEAQKRYPAESAERAKQQAVEEARAAAAKEQACIEEQHCWFERYSADASRACKPEIQKLARYDYKWDDFSWEILERFNVDALGVIHGSGSGVRFQNAFGVWVKENYRCDYDPRTQTATNVGVWN